MCSMTKQLTLVPTDPATDDVPAAPRSVASVLPRRPAAETAETDTESEWRLDDATVAIGMRGLASARAALMNSGRDTDAAAA